MPKIAEKYEYLYENSSNIADFKQYHHYSVTHKKIERPKNKPKTKKKKLVPTLIALSFILGILFVALPFTFNNVTKTMFNPTPYDAITTDYQKLLTPTMDYLSNSWFLGNRLFSYSADPENAQMLPLKENVNMPVLKQELLHLLDIYPTVQPSIYVWDYETQNYIDINANKSYATASIIKIPILIDLFKSIEAGEFSLEDKIPLTEYYRTEGSGSLQFKARDSKYTIDKLAELMITESDNSATNMLISKVGAMTDVNQAIRDWGLKNTYIQTWLPDLLGTNRTTAREMATMLYNIDENNKFLTENSRSKILNYMSHVHNNRLIQAGLGPDAVFYHKTGDIGTMLGDAGIVITPNGKKYLIVILANRPHNSVAGKDFIVHASKIVYNYMAK